MKYRVTLILTACVVLLSCGEQSPDPRADVNVIQAANRVGDAEAKGGRAAVTIDVPQLLDTYCVSCHGQEKQKGKIRFDTLDALRPADRSDLLSRAREALHFGDMPPAGKPQPTDAELRKMMAWMQDQLDPQADAKLKDKMRYPHYGNLVDHDLLFSGEIDEPAYTPARRWLVSPQIFHARVMDVFKLEGHDRASMQAREFAGVTNPFLLPSHSGVKYYDFDALDGGDLLVMLGNAKWIANRQIAIARRIGGEKVEFDNPKDRWMPRQAHASYEAFTTIIQKPGAPTRQEMVDAIQTQFDCVLQRPATPDELQRYLKLLRSAIDQSDNQMGLRQMMIAALLESEFVYRMEFGDGKPDAHGREKMTPREAAYAIAYALGDRGPDEPLMRAAREGRLTTKEDYKREVERLLADTTYYRGPVDPTLNGKHYQSNETSHPRIVRFFRDFFGYRAAAGVFKDPPRALNRYQNPSRGTVGSPGWLIREADLIVTYHVENDREVFKNLLTSDKYFVYDQLQGEKGRAIIDQWKLVWDTLKDTPWQTQPQQVLEENFDFIKAQQSLRINKLDDKRAVGNFVTHMRFFMDYFPKGKTPYPRGPWTHGYYINHSIFYGLPPTPMRGQYYTKPHSPEHWAKQQAEADAWWDYPLEQPFSIPNRKGILSHPAWLIAHSLNFHTDPIRRGRWIREKLLAGRVPDVPITVDAQVPDDPEKTFRTRVEEVTAPDECWKCHKHMNPLGLPFEMYDDFGRDRTEEELEHPDNLIKRGNGKTSFDQYPTLPIDATGALSGTGDSGLDGEVDDALQLIDRLGASDRVRQSIIRHAFRFYMGRNEMLSDSQTLIDADRAYVKSGGSFRAVIVSLLTSDSFMYRKEMKD
jgi:mono/diheme cytochrome c family protein